MIISIDGGEPMEIANDVTVIFDDQIIDTGMDTEAVIGKVYVKITDEGIIVDTIDNEDEEVYSTASIDLDTIVEWCQ